MRRACIALALCASLLLCGCGGMFDKEYYYSAPFARDSRRRSGGATEIGNYNILKSALIDLISDHEEHGSFRFSRYNGSVADDVAAACLEIRTANPLGAYAVETLTCDTSRIVSYYTAEINVTYKRSAEDIQRIVGVGGLPELRERLRAAVGDCADQLVVRVYSSQVDGAYLANTVAQFQLEEPVAVVEAPEVTVESYPNEGVSRIHDLRFRYNNPPEELQAMSQQLYSRVLELISGITAEDRPHLALECAETLYDLVTPDADASQGSAYTALVEGRAGSKGIALAYKALCDALGLECLVVHGNAGTLGAEEHYWNILGLEGDHYHVDVSGFGGARSDAFLLRDAQLWGTYLWDAEAYPACDGALRYTDLVPPKPNGDDPDAPQDLPAEAQPEPPDETPEAPAPAETPEPSETPEPAETQEGAAELSEM